jgi:dihydroneopterin aldolase
MRVCIGCTAEERAAPQDVDLDVAIRFAALPRACETDQLTDTVNYSDLIKIARDLSAQREFKLVEHLAAELHAKLLAQLPPHAELWLRVTKLRPLVEDLHGGVSFSIGDR